MPDVFFFFYTLDPVFGCKVQYKIKISTQNKTFLQFINSLMPTSQIVPIRRIQNSAARLVCRVKRREHVTSFLRSLHWLPVTQSIKYKILLLTYLTVNGHAPTYLQGLIPSKVPSHSFNLWSSYNSQFQLANGPRTYTRYGQRAFAVAATSLRNNLPLHIRQATSNDSLKSLLKTHLFVTSGLST